MPQSVNLTGTLIYDPEACWNGYTLLPCCTFHSGKGAVLIDMNGNVVQKWEGVMGAYHNILFPDGSIMGSSGENKGHRHDNKDLIHVDFNNELIWKCEKPATIELPDGTVVESARQHHDFQRHGNPVGYYVPGQEPEHDGKTLFLSTKVIDCPEITHIPFADTWVVEVDQEGNVLWDWLISDHWDELGISEVAKAVYSRSTIMLDAGYTKDTYLNNCAYLGPNKWYDAGDERFNPENIIVDIRSWNVSFIISKETKEIVWRLGPDYTSDPRWEKIGAIIGQHQVHMIPRGLPGEGNILIFDNGSQAGFGNSTQVSPDGIYTERRGYSRVLEIDPTTYEVVWKYGEDDGDYENKYLLANLKYHFFSSYCSGMQRLPNGNTLICECVGGRVFEVTPNKKIVWEYVDPGLFTFRAFRYPYNWVPQVDQPAETPVVPPKPSSLRLRDVQEEHFMEEFYNAEARWA